MPTFKPAYLIHGTDHGRIGERRARLRTLAEAEAGAGGVELLEGDTATTTGLADALATPTLALGRRFVIVDGVERWRDADVEAALAGPLGDLPDETTVALFGREDARTKVPAALLALVKRAGGDISEERELREWELPKWVAAEARRMGIELDASAAKALVAQVGERQQRLLRELEKLTLGAEPGHRFHAEEVHSLTARSSERQIWSLADALVARDAPAATRLFLRLRSQGERIESLSYWMTRRLRMALDVSRKLEQGASVGEVRRGLRMPPRVAEAFVADVGRTDSGRLEEDIVGQADLELATRGVSELDADTLALRAIAGQAGP